MIDGYKPGTLSYSSDSQGDSFDGTLVIRGVADEAIAVFDALTNVTATHVGAGVWEASFTYSDPSDEDSEEAPEIGDVEWSIDRSTSQQKIYIALMEDVFVKPGADAPDFAKIIGQTKDGGEVEGVDKFYAAATYTETHYLDPQDWDMAKSREFAIKETVQNSATFRVWEKNELLFLSFSVQKQKGQAILPVSFSWAVSANAENLTIGEIQNIKKPGHDYLWARTVKDENNFHGIQKPEVVVVNQIYHDEDFNSWGLAEPTV